MAQLLADIQSALSTRFGPELDRQFNRMTVTSSLLRKVDGQGKQISWDVRVPRSTHAASFSEGSDVTAGEFNVDPTIPAVLNWPMYRVAFSLSGLSVAAAANSPMSATELLDQFGTNLTDAASDMASVINADLYGGDGTGTKITGFVSGGAITATGIYAGINRATYSTWASTVLANGGTPRALTKAMIDTLEADIYIASGRIPRLIIAEPNVVRKYESLFDTVTRVQIERGDLSNMSKTPTVGTSPFLPDNEGYTGYSYKGIPIYRDKDATSGAFFMLNPDYVELPTMPQPSLGTTVMTRQMAAPSQTVGGSNGINFKVESLAKTGDADKFQLIVYVNLKVRRPNSCGYIADIDVS